MFFSLLDIQFVFLCTCEIDILLKIPLRGQHFLCFYAHLVVNNSISLKPRTAVCCFSCLVMVCVLLTEKYPACGHSIDVKSDSNIDPEPGRDRAKMILSPKKLKLP